MSFAAIGDAVITDALSILAVEWFQIKGLLGLYR